MEARERKTGDGYSTVSGRLCRETGRVEVSLLEEFAHGGTPKSSLLIAATGDGPLLDELFDMAFDTAESDGADSARWYFMHPDNHGMAMEEALMRLSEKERDACHAAALPPSRGARRARI